MTFLNFGKLCVNRKYKKSMKSQRVVGNEVGEKDIGQIT